jgi:hypothetical protein
MQTRVEPIGVGRRRIWIHSQTPQEHHVLNMAASAHEPCFAFVAGKDWDLWQHDPYAHDDLVQEGKRLFARRVVVTPAGNDDFYVDTAGEAYGQEVLEAGNINELMLVLEMIWAKEEERRLSESLVALKRSVVFATDGAAAPDDQPAFA